MATSSPTTEKPMQKRSQVLPTNYHLPEKQYYGCLNVGSENHYTGYFDTIEEAMEELRCLEKRMSFELIKTVEMEGVYPQRAILIEEAYQKSGRTDGLYTGLCTEE
jgi:hypothetical protein